jgi:thioredoxin 1
MGVVTLNEDNFRSEVLESELPVVVDFYADWCGPCKQIAPVIEALSERWAGEVAFAKVDIEAYPAIASGYNVSSIPAVLRFERGEVTRWSLGAKPAHVLERELKLKGRGTAARADSKGFLGRLLGR